MFAYPIFISCGSIKIVKAIEVKCFAEIIFLTGKAWNQLEVALETFLVKK